MAIETSTRIPQHAMPSGVDGMDVSAWENVGLGLPNLTPQNPTETSAAPDMRAELLTAVTPQAGEVAVDSWLNSQTDSTWSPYEDTGTTMGPSEWFATNSPPELTSKFTEHTDTMEKIEKHPGYFKPEWAGSKLEPWMVDVEEGLVRQEISTMFSYDPAILRKGSKDDREVAQLISQPGGVIDRAVALLNKSQIYVSENSTFPKECSEGQILEAIVTCLPRGIDREVCNYSETVAKLIESVEQGTQNDSVKNYNDDMGMVIYASGETDVEQYIKKGQTKLAQKLQELIADGSTDIDALKLDYQYFQMRIEQNGSLEHDPSIAAAMISGMGISAQLACDIALSTRGPAGNPGLAMIGLNPGFGLKNIYEHIKNIGVETIEELHDEMGITSFYRYSTNDLEFMGKVIHEDPATLERLRGQNTLVSLLDSKDDYNGVLAGSYPSTELTHGQSIPFEIGDGNGKTLKEQVNKYAAFLSQRGINIETLLIGGHGDPGSGGIVMGGLRLEIDQVGDMAPIFKLLNNGATIIVNSCSQGAQNEEVGHSMTGEFARQANIRHKPGSVVAYGVSRRGGFKFIADNGAASGIVDFANGPANAMQAIINDAGEIVETALSDIEQWEHTFDLGEEEKYKVIPVPALGGVK